MKLLRASLLLQAACAGARFVEETEMRGGSNVELHPERQQEYLIELSPGETRWVTEEQKWELRRVCSSSLAPR